MSDSVEINYELPKTVRAIRDGWQWTCSSGAVVSGLLASAAAQLLGTFKVDTALLSREPRSRNLVLILCYAALFLNISATISSFILTDNLGEIEYRAARGMRPSSSFRNTNMGAEKLLKEYGASRQWKWMLWHWLITFYFGILSLIMSVLSFVWLSESPAVSITMSIFVGFTLLPVTWFILIRPYFDSRSRSRILAVDTSTAATDPQHDVELSDMSNSSVAR